MSWLVFLLDLAARIASTSVAKLVFALVQRLDYRRLLNLRSAHLHELTNKIEGMPFLYRDLKLDVLADFVEGDIRSLDRNSYTPVERPSFDSRGMFERLRDARRILLVGQAGIGKTTLFRYSIHSLIVGDQRGLKLQKEEFVVPFYVPLKALDNASPSPIIRYLLSNNRYLGSRSGIRRLEKLARRAELLILLDGYDEVPHAGGTKYIVDELGALFALSGGEALNEFSNSPYREIYGVISKCRIWISSRREFLTAFPFNVAGDVALLAAVGIGRQRIRLVENIFQRYRATGGAFFDELLNSERFMQQIAMAKDTTLQELSSNPLFLTVMCYVYVEHVKKRRASDDVWKGGVFELIAECLQLLLEDIDEYKTRGLNPIYKRALMSRRSSYSAEKLEFLRYLAAQTYFKSVPLLTKAYLIQEARTFFSSSSEPNAPLILRGLDSADPTANIVEQLVMSGVFVFVEKGSAGERMDFPHRRFREVLATEHLNNEDGCNRLRQRVADPQFSELLLVYFEKTPYAESMVSALIEALSSASNVFEVGVLLNSSLRSLRQKINPADVMLKILGAVRGCDPGLDLPESLLEHLAPSSYERIGLSMAKC